MNEPANHITRYMTYYTQRHCSTQWKQLLTLVFDELFSSADRAETLGFWRHIGQRMAVAYPLDECETLETLEAHMNDVFARLDWGWTALSAEEKQVRICHMACPVPGHDETEIEQGLLAMSAVLEGLYAKWFSQQGGKRHVPLHCQSRNQKLREVVLAYGH